VTVSQSQKVEVKSVPVPARFILLQAREQSLIVIEDHILECSSLRFVQQSLLRHFTHHSKKHA
jgi:hypothetical protein